MQLNTTKVLMWDIYFVNLITDALIQFWTEIINAESAKMTKTKADSMQF